MRCAERESESARRERERERWRERKKARARERERFGVQNYPEGTSYVGQGARERGGEGYGAKER